MTFSLQEEMFGTPIPRCSVCNRRLKDAKSIARGMGSSCAKRVGGENNSTGYLVAVETRARKMGFLRRGGDQEREVALLQTIGRGIEELRGATGISWEVFGKIYRWR